MPQSRLPDPVLAFLARHIRTADDLHLLAAVAAERDRWWDASSVARELMVERGEARLLLEHLAAHNLLEIRVTGDIRYQFRPGTAQLRDDALATIESLRIHPVAVWRSIADSRGRRSIRDFADAFRIRRDDEE